MTDTPDYKVVHHGTQEVFRTDSYLLARLHVMAWTGLPPSVIDCYFEDCEQIPAGDDYVSFQYVTHAHPR